MKNKKKRVADSERNGPPRNTHTHILRNKERKRERKRRESKSNGEQRRIYKGKRRKRRRWFAKLRASRNSLREAVKHLNHTRLLLRLEIRLQPETVQVSCNYAITVAHDRDTSPTRKQRVHRTHEKCFYDSLLL